MKEIKTFFLGVIEKSTHEPKKKSQKLISAI